MRITRFRIRRTPAGQWKVSSTGGTTPWVCDSWQEAMDSVDRVHACHVQAAMPFLGRAAWAAMNE